MKIPKHSKRMGGIETKKKGFIAVALLAVLCAVFSAAAAEAPVPTAAPKPLMTRDPRAGVYQPTPTPVPPAPTATPVRRPNVVMLSSPSVNIEADRKDVQVYFPNSPKNEGWYDLAFTLWAAIPAEAIQEGVETAVFQKKNAETGEMEPVVLAKLFSSGLVPAGMCLQAIEMTQGVPAGTYDAILVVQSYYVDTGLPTPNGASTSVTLNVKRSEAGDR